MRPAMVVVVAALALGVGLAVGLSLGRGRGPEAPAAGAAEAERVVLLERENAGLRETLALERAAAAGAPAPVPATASDPDPRGAASVAGATPAGAPAAATTRFLSDLHDGALASVDFSLIGRNLKEMGPLVAEIARAITTGTPVAPGTIGRIQQLNGPLVEAALSLGDSVPGTGVNGRFSDPGFMLNAIASCLAAADLPLSAGQAAVLEDIARRCLAADAQRRAAYDDRTPALQRVYEEAELKDGFFRDAFAELTAEQRAIVDPPEARDRLRLSVFSSAVLWAPLTEPCFFQTDADLKKQFLLRSVQILDLSEAEQERARGIVDSWVDSVPDDLVDAPTDEFDRRVMVKSQRVTAWAKHTVRLIGTLLDTLALDEPRAARGRGAGGVLLPLKVEELPG